MSYFIDEIKTVLDTPKQDIDIEKAALLLLKMNRNKILYKNIIRKKLVDKLLYELNKIYNTHVQSHLLVKTAKMEVSVQEIVEKIPEITQAEAPTPGNNVKGKREDHDELPDEIQAYYLENFDILRRMRKTHEQLKLMNDKRPCDRYPYLSELLELDTQLRGNWHHYDTYIIGTPIVSTQDGENIQTVADPKKVSAARKYLSDNKKKLENLEGDARTALIAKMQERYKYLASTNAGISDEQVQEYKTLGLDV